MKTQDFKTPEEFHSKLSLVFNAAIALPLLPFVYLFLEVKNNAYSGQIGGGWALVLISYGLPILSGLLVATGLKSVEASKMAASKVSSLKEKLISYYPGILRFYVLVGIAGLIMTMGLWLTSSGVIIVAYVIMLFAMSLYRPTPRRYCKDLSLEKQDKDIIMHHKDSLL